jgi:outer membrane immunogenic protein
MKNLAFGKFIGASALCAWLSFLPVYAAGPVLRPSLDASDHNWNGFYIGANAGIASGQSLKLSGNGPFQFFIDNDTVPRTIAVFPLTVSGGGQIGYNMRIKDSLSIVGFEADFNMMSLSESEDYYHVLGVLRITHAEHKLDWLSTLRVRTGFMPQENMLIYGTGGLAFGRASSAVSFTGTGGCPISTCSSASNSSTSLGWVAGAGIEFALKKNWSVKGEYLYYDLNDNRTAGQDARFAPLGWLYSDDPLKGRLVRAGINYKFN